MPNLRERSATVNSSTSATAWYSISFAKGKHAAATRSGMAPAPMYWRTSEWASSRLVKRLSGFVSASPPIT